MSKIEVCDICKSPIMEKFTDTAYKVTKQGHAYDGFAPFRRKWSVDLCGACMYSLTQALKLSKKVSKIITPLENM